MVNTSKNRAFGLGAFLFLVTLSVDLAMILMGLTFAGIISLIGTLLVFSSGLIWLIYQNDQRLHMSSMWLVLPLSIAAVGVARALNLTGVGLLYTSESLAEVGNLLMARYQLGLWVVSIFIFFGFIVGASLMMPKKT